MKMGDQPKKEDSISENKGQGELYSPDNAIKANTQNQKRNIRGVAADIRRNLGMMRERLLEKLTAASVPADALDNARQFLESVIRDVTVAAHGLTKDALNRIKTHLVEIIPSLSPQHARKIVDEAEKEVNIPEGKSGEEEKEERDNSNIERNQQEGNTSKTTYMSPTSSYFVSLVKPLSRL